MKYRCRLLNKPSQRFLLALLVVYPFNLYADNIWSYHQESEPSTNRSYSLAQSPLPPRGVYDNIRLEVVCKDNTLQVLVDADSLIASQGSSFDFEYQIDKNPPVNIKMKTSKDSKRKGYTEENALRMTGDFLTGQSIFIRINTMIREVLSAAIPLEKVAEPIKQVVADCGLSLSAPSPAGLAYSLAEFEQAFAKLSSSQQQQVLGKIKEIVTEINKIPQ